MYQLKDTIPNVTDENLISEVSFNPEGTLFAVTYLNSHEVVVFDARTRSAVREFKNPEADLDYPHGVLFTENHLIVSNVHGLTRPSTFTVYNINNTSDKPVSVFITPYKNLREAHSLAIHNNVLVATYCHNSEGVGAIVSYQFDDNAGVIQAPLDIVQDCFKDIGDPKGLAFSKDGSTVFVTYFTQKEIGGLPKFIPRIKAARVEWKERNLKEFFQYLHEKLNNWSSKIPIAQKNSRNGVAMFDIDNTGRFTKQPTNVFERETYCRLENIDIVDDTVVITDTINGSVGVYDLAEDPQLKAPKRIVTESISLPHGVKLSPDKSMLVVTNYGLKIEKKVIYWNTPSSDNNRGVLVYDQR